ncbi:undecaprenyldiphospho-muramoylpentapeptide beta-N-acetylglucosaminyltransferase [Candidatus Nucleicultrix amoebiphila]|uniref:undecaprenyldiphospho-muramoylpentapeptide beta-N-acetylglucosaminyltransferase n=1 Tax=Candidatus Nucleicultrix amoebiphila TaxID=1509244 RepID=UPI000A26FE29|nr:undecaprenyldiphospho-muramoylpentapeptide beta-N-acetylglucosaminyltransferase [Candidatus Nucleicultrix amoebiphila]
MKYSIAIAAGGTGGHVLPAKALALELIKLGHKVLFMTDPRGNSYLQNSEPFSVEVLPLPLRRNGKGKVLFYWGLLKSCLTSFKLIKSRNIQSVIGFGGYPSFPLLTAAVLFRVPIVLHEQNAVLGRVNRLFLPFTSKLAISFPKTLKIKSVHQQKVVVTGLPVRPVLLEARKKDYEIPPSKGYFNLFILGGSQGAQIFNQILPEVIASLPLTQQKRLRIFQQCPKGTIESLKKSYEKTQAKVTIKEFYENVPELLHLSHLIIARSGAATVSEIAAVGRPAVLVPFSQALDDHQTENAKAFTGPGGGWLLPENACLQKNLEVLIKGLMSDPKPLFSAAEKSRHFGKPKALKELTAIMCNKTLYGKRKLGVSA